VAQSADACGREPQFCGFEARPGHGPVVESGRHTSLRTRRPLHGSSSLPRPTSSTPVAESVDAARSKRVSTCRFDSCREYHAPDRTVTVAASKTAIRGSIPRGCAMWEMPKWSRRRSAKPLLPGSSPGSHSIGGREARQRFLVPKTSAPGGTRMGVRLLRAPPQH
jgi:hypothetical protein